MMAVIGGGPVGAYSAYLLSKIGYDVDIYEDHNEIGKPVQCTGIVTSAINEILQVPQDVIVNKVNVMRVHAPNGKSIDLKLKEPDLILDRTKLDAHIVQKAVDNNVGLFLGHRLTGMEGKKLKFNVGGQIKFVEHSKYVIGADGPLSVVGKSMGSHVKRFFVGSQSVVEDSFEKNIVDVFLFKKGFGWVVPENESRARIGVLGYKDSNTKLQEILKAYPRAKVIENQGGLIPIYNPMLKTYSNNTFLIGDAAGMVKATTGGGIVQGLMAAEQLAKSMKTKQNYETLWKQKLGKSLLLHLGTRKVLDRFNDNDLNHLIEMTSQDKLKTVLAEHNRDNPLKLGMKMLSTEPKYLLFLKTLLNFG
jgi:digeranylgeranylglycerophospholipid reductase